MEKKRPSRRHLRILPWIITLAALYYAFQGVDWKVLASHIGNAKPLWIGTAGLLTCISYALRSRRWQFLFPKRILDYTTALRVLLLGFFMNNILPARTGEFVRAHLGAKATGETRTLVLATIASERLVDGFTLSIFFVIFALGVGSHELSQNLLYVAIFFAGATIAVLITLTQRARVFTLADRLSQKFTSKASNYTFNRLQVFIDGLTPLATKKSVIIISLWSLLVWGIELLVYFSITRAFSADVSLPICVLFLVAVNFSSLIPAAPGGIGVIEAIASTVLASTGIPRELALTMVIAQHVIQYLVVGIPGALIMLSWKGSIKPTESLDNENAEVNQV